MNKTVILHIGAPKTGTTYLQQVLWRNRSALADEGVCYPLERPTEHFHAALDLRDMAWAGRRDPAWDGAWERVAQRACQWTGARVVLSNELLGGASEEQARAAVTSLGSADVHVVVTVRDLARQIPSGWQEHLKHQHPVRLGDFCADLLDGGAGGQFGRGFWRVHDVVAVLRRWNAAVPAARIHVVTVPQAGSGAGLLWHRFASAAGLTPGRYDTRIKRDNVAIGIAEAELLYRVNQALQGRLSPRHYDPVVRRTLAETILARRPHSGRIELPPEYDAAVGDLSKTVVADIRERGYQVVGDLDDLQPEPAARRNPGEAPATEVLDAAVDAIAGLAVQMGKIRDRSGTADESASGTDGEPSASLFKHRVRSLSERYPAVMRGRRIWWRSVQRGQEARIRLRRRARRRYP